MKTRMIGRDLEVSAVGLGCMGMTHAYGAPADKREMTELIAQAVDQGCTFLTRRKPTERGNAHMIMRNWWERL